MKPKLKIAITGLAVAAILFNISCNKTSTLGTTPKTDKNLEIARMVATGLLRSSASLGTTSNSLKTGSESGLKTNDNDHDCGQVVIKSSNKTFAAGDTTRTVYNTDRFTYMCNGFRSNNYNIDAYTQQDTLITTDKGNGFKNIFKVTLDYDVRATSYDYVTLTVNGFTSTSSYTSKLNGNTTVESRLINTGYTWKNVIAQHIYPEGNTSFVAGKVDFTTRIIDINGATSASGNATDFTGYILYQAVGDLAGVNIKLPDGTYTGYIVNIRTGEIIAK